LRYALLILALTGCSSYYKPTTVEGITCKQQCAKLQLLCNGEVYSCQQGYGHCIETCKAMDHLKEK